MASLDNAEPQDEFRATKRKLDDAFLELDNSVLSTELADGPRPPKRSTTSRSIYSTLTKYGISTRIAQPPSGVTPITGLTKPTPHLSAILARAATRTKSILSVKSDKSSSSMFSSNAEYRPSSVASFLSRLSTFKLTTYANKPPQVDAVAASKCGWMNDGKDRLVCGICGASWVVAGRDGMSRDAANALVEKQRASLVSAHKNGCPWQTRQCDPSIYRIPLQSPAATLKGIKTIAISLSEPLKDVTAKHPLTQSQVNSVKTTVLSYNIPANSEAAGQEPDADPPSETAILAALFGWSIVPSTSNDLRKPSFSRSTTSISGTPVRSPSVSRASTPIQGTPLKFNIPSGKLNKRDTLLHCTLCQRRIGLWTFLEQTITSRKAVSTNGSDADPSPVSTPRKTVQQRHFDLLREHRSYCPYVVRSTTIPTYPTPPSSMSSSNGQLKISQSNSDGIMEGWRAVLTVVLRYGLVQKQALDHDPFSPEDESLEVSSEAMEVDGVKAMVAGVKSRGGRDLLKYVKGLLG